MSGTNKCLRKKWIHSSWVIMLIQKKNNLSKTPLNDEEQLKFSEMQIVPFAHFQG